MKMESVRMLFSQLGLASNRPAKRIAKARSGWGIETEKLEDRALLSAAARCVEGAVAADVAHSHGKAAAVANVAGNWNVELSGGPLSGVDVVNFAQTGKVVTGNFSAFGVSVAIKGKLNGTTAKVTATINFSGQPFKLKGIVVTYSNNFTTFDGSKSVPSVPGVGTLNIHGTRVVT